MRIAVIGAGPMGLEAALYARRLGHEVTVLERGRVGEGVRRWAQVAMFTPWRLNVSTLAAEELAARGWTCPDPEGLPRGGDLAERFLLPLADALGESVRTGVRVVGAARAGLLKGESIGGDRRAARPFRLLLEDRAGERSWMEADVVLDASGVEPARLGSGSLCAPGEERCAEAIVHGLPDVLGADRSRCAGKRVLLAGAGHSAATSLLALERLRREAPGTTVIWVIRSRKETPFPADPADPLPARRELEREANRLSCEDPSWLSVRRGMAVERLERTPEGIRARLEGPSGAEEAAADIIIASCGHIPDLSLSRELQAHHCYASEGPMRLAAQLLGGSGDCMKAPRIGPEAHRHPEPGFFTLGMKSYGRGSAFLLRTGRQAIRDVFRAIQGDAGLDLYREEA